MKTGEALRVDRGERLRVTDGVLVPFVPTSPPRVRHVVPLLKSTGRFLSSPCASSSPFPPSSPARSMTEYTSDPIAVAQYHAARARTGAWVQTLAGVPTRANPSAPPSLVDDSDAEDGLPSPVSVDSDSDTSLPPRMVLRYPDGRDVAIGPSKEERLAREREREHRRRKGKQRASHGSYVPALSPPGSALFVPPPGPAEHITILSSSSSTPHSLYAPYPAYPSHPSYPSSHSHYPALPSSHATARYAPPLLHTVPSAPVVGPSARSTHPSSGISRSMPVSPTRTRFSNGPVHSPSPVYAFSPDPPVAVEDLDRESEALDTRVHETPRALAVHNPEPDSESEHEHEHGHEHEPEPARSFIPEPIHTPDATSSSQSRRHRTRPPALVYAASNHGPLYASFDPPRIVPSSEYPLEREHSLSVPAPIPVAPSRSDPLPPSHHSHHTSTHSRSRDALLPSSLLSHHSHHSRHAPSHSDPTPPSHHSSHHSSHRSRVKSRSSWEKIHASSIPSPDRLPPVQAQDLQPMSRGLGLGLARFYSRGQRDRDGARDKERESGAREQGRGSKLRKAPRGMVPADAPSDSSGSTYYVLPSPGQKVLVVVRPFHSFV